MNHDKLIIFDIDNTLYNFVDFFGPTFRSMVHALANVSKISEEKIIANAKSVYQQAGTLEHQILIRNMPIFSDLPKDTLDKYVITARQAFSRTRKVHLKPYDHIRNVLELAKEDNCKCILLTNAPVYHVHKRLVDLSLFEFIDGLLAWKGSAIDQEDSEHYRKYVNKIRSISNKLEMVVELNDNQRKPSTYAYELVKEKYSNIGNFFVVGDSVTKDLTPAKKCGYRTIFAKYGTIVNQKNLDTLIEITPWSEDEIKTNHTIDYDPDYIADSASQILEFVGISSSRRQSSLF